MQIGSERAHCHHFVFVRSNNSCERFAVKMMIVEPGILRLKMPLNAQIFPVNKFLLNIFSRFIWQETEGISGEVNHFFSFHSWNMKARTVFLQRIIRIECVCEGK